MYYHLETKTRISNLLSDLWAIRASFHKPRFSRITNEQENLLEHVKTLITTLQEEEVTLDLIGQAEVMTTIFWMLAQEQGLVTKRNIDE